MYFCHLVLTVMFRASDVPCSVQWSLDGCWRLWWCHQSENNWSVLPRNQHMEVRGTSMLGQPIDCLLLTAGPFFESSQAISYYSNDVFPFFVVVLYRDNHILNTEEYNISYVPGLTVNIFCIRITFLGFFKFITLFCIAAMTCWLYSNQYNGNWHESIYTTGDKHANNDNLV